MLNEKQRTWLHRQISKFMDEHPISDMLDQDKATKIVNDADRITATAKGDVDVKEVVLALLIFYDKAARIIRG